MKNYFFLFMLIACASFKAQKVIVKVDSATGGKLIIDAEEGIIKMIDEKELCKKISVAAATSPENKPAAHPSAPKTVCGKRNDIPGFMIKVAETKSEQEINTMMTNFRTEFPELRVEKSYLRPDWRLLAGDYFKKESGQTDLKKVKKSFPTAMMINWRIYCNRAK
ncbi:MAG: hypothetical protein LBP34_03090 [Flavobacteriaceae bacterium]|jgi:hypothetical protein|nr:hypothetical protein [Flavobacteriaceae bacterium]